MVIFVSALCIVDQSEEWVVVPNAQQHWQPGKTKAADPFGVTAIDDSGGYVTYTPNALLAQTPQLKFPPSLKRFVQNRSDGKSWLHGTVHSVWLQAMFCKACLDDEQKGTQDVVPFESSNHVGGVKVVQTGFAGASPKRAEMTKLNGDVRAKDELVAQDGS